MKRAILIISFCLTSIVLLSGCRAILDQIIPPAESEPAETTFIEATAIAQEATATPTATLEPTSTPTAEPTTEPTSTPTEEPESATSSSQVDIQPVEQAISGYTCSDNLEQASNVSVAATWQEGESRSIEVIKRHTQSVNGEVQVIESVTDIRISVLEVVDDGFILEWVFGKTNIDLPALTAANATGNSLLQRLGAVLEGIRVEYETDRLGIYRGLRNVAEIADQKDDLFEALVAEMAGHLSDDEARIVATDVIEDLMGSPQQIEVAFSQDIQLYHALFGSTLDSKNPILFASLVPTLFSSDVIPSLNEIHLIGYDANDGCAVAQMQGKVDGERAKQTILTGYFKRLEESGIAPPSSGSEPDVTLEEKGQYHIDLNVGWLRSMDHLRRTLIGSNEFSEKTFLIDKSAGAAVAVAETAVEADGEAQSTTVATDVITESNVSTVTVPTVQVPLIEPAPTNPFPNAFVGIANSNANLRSGPGTENERVGRAAAGDILFVVDTNSAEDWYLLHDDTWIAAFLVDRAPDDVAAETTPPFPIPGTAFAPPSGGDIPLVPVPAIDVTVPSVAISGTTSLTGTAAISTTGVITPTPQPLTEQGNPLLTEEEKENAIKAILQIPLIKDAVIVQDELTVSLIIGMKNEVDAKTAEQVGDNFVRLVKAYANAEANPDQSIGEGIYDYFIYVVTAEGNDIAVGIKERSAKEISW